MTISTQTDSRTSTSTSANTPPKTSDPTNHSNSFSGRPRLQTLHKQGFVIVPSLLSAAEVSALRAACAHTATLARSGKWPHIRTLPKQFPPWPSTPPAEGIWGVQHLLHPDMPGRAVFAASYFHDRLLHIADEILGITSSDSDQNEPFVMELYNLLVRPDSDFELRWHRDDIPPTASTAEEEAALGISGAGHKRLEGGYSHTQWNLALEPDDSLLVVPGTHARARTQTERDAGLHDELPGQLVVHLEPGDAVFYDNDILHRGRYSAGRERFTLHGSLGKRGFGDKRARNVLQHGVGSWIDRCELGSDGSGDGGGALSRVSRRAEGMRRNLVLMGSGREVQYSQTD